MRRIIVIGAGQAGASLVAKLRANGFADELILLGAEPVPPYQRPPLSKAYLLGEMALDRLFLRPKSYYQDNGIALRLGQRVSFVDPVAKTVFVGEETLGYDTLVFTTGSEPRRLSSVIGGDLDGVYSVRNLADVDAMGSEFISDRRVLIVGGGYIGLEAAAVAAKRGLDVTLIEMAPRILQRVAAPQTADNIRALHESHGVRILEGVGLSRLTGEHRVTGALLSNDQELSIDFAIVGVGIAPATSLAEAAGLKIDNGIWTDAQGRTSDPSIWAAGDCASFPMNGHQLRLESVGHAIDHAETVAVNILGEGVEYRPRPWFWSDQYDTKLQIAGLNTGYDLVVTRDGDAGSCSIWYYNQSRLLAVDAINDPRAYMVGKRMIEAGLTVPPGIIKRRDLNLKDILSVAKPNGETF